MSLDCNNFLYMCWSFPGFSSSWACLPSSELEHLPSSVKPFPPMISHDSKVICLVYGLCHLLTFQRRGFQINCITILKTKNTTFSYELTWRYKEKHLTNFEIFYFSHVIIHDTRSKHLLRGNTFTL
jgi:hypothetical protein